MVTQIGSLPFEDVNKAIDYSLRHDIPFLPELPKRGEFMLDYIKNPGRLSCLDEFKKSVKGYETVKAQCVGPATLVRYGGYSESEAIRRATEHISSILDGLDSKEVILFLDEPAIGQVDFNYRELWEQIFGRFNVIRGVHNCGDANWNMLFDADINIISFDSSKYGVTRSSNYRNGKRIAWGVQRREDVKDFRDGDLLTMPCGMAFDDERACGENLEMLIEAAREVAH